MTQPNGNGNGGVTANSAVSNTAAHCATGTASAAAGAYLVARRGWDPTAAMAAIAVAGGLFGRLGSWANARKAEGSTNPVVWLLSSWG